MISKKKTTSRKFYGKWLYKVTLKINGVSILRTNTLENTIGIVMLPESQNVSRYGVTRRALSNPEEIVSLCKFLQTLNPDDYTKRLESNLIDFYTNDKNIYENFCNLFDSLITHHFEPEEKSVDLLAKSNYIVVSKFPHDKFRYKVYLTPHKLRQDRQRKQQFLSWLDTQNDRIRISDTVKDWFIKTEWNWDRRYVLVTDEATLLMMKMANPDAVGKVYEHVLLINT